MNFAFYKYTSGLSPLKLQVADEECEGHIPKSKIVISWLDSSIH
jgi:hypothetical protein